MMKVFKESDFKSLEQFVRKNKITDLKAVELDGLASLSSAKGKQPPFELLKAVQQLQQFDTSVSEAANLLKAGMHSALQITEVSEHLFVEQYAETVFNKEESRAVSTYRKAQGIKNEMQIRFIDLMQNAEPHINAGFFNQGAAQQGEELFPQFAEILENANGCACEHCASVLSPAAYYVELKKLVSKYITESEEVQYKLATRRPDLVELNKPENLTCENSLNPTPYLNIVNRVMERQVGDEPYKTLAEAVYPFNLPANLHLFNANRYLEKLDTSMASLYKTFALNPTPKITAREYLQLSDKEFGIITTACSDEVQLKAFYGLDKEANLIHTLSDFETFSHRTQLSTAAVEELFYQNLNSAEIEIGNAALFFINSGKPTNEVREYVGVREGRIILITAATPEKPETASDLTAAHLDRVNRFVRLAKRINWPFADLDLVLRSSCKNTLDEYAISIIATIKHLYDTTEIPLNVLCSCWAELNSLGMGQQPIFKYEDLFNRTFNNHIAESYKTYLLPNDDKATVALYKKTYPGLEAETVENSARLLAAFHIKQEELNQISEKIKPARKGTKSIDSRVASINRYVQIAQVLGVSIDELMLLFDLVGEDSSLPDYNPFSIFIDFDFKAAKIDPHKIVQTQNGDVTSILWLVQLLKQITAGLKEQQLSVYQAAYGCKGANQEMSQFLSNDQLTALFQNLHRQFQHVLVTSRLFESATINNTEAQKLANLLVKTGYVSKEGIVLKRTWPFPAINHNVSLSKVDIPVHPVENESFYFNGTDAYLDCGAEIDIRDTDFTIEFWIKRDQLGKASYVVGQGLNHTDFLHIGFKDDNKLRFGLGSGDMDTKEAYLDQDWHHWACVYKKEGYVKEIYRDGKQVETVLVHDNRAYTATGSWLIGKFLKDVDSANFSGNISEVRVWDHARTVTQITTKMQNRLKPNEKGLVGYWPLSKAYTILEEIANRQQEALLNGLSDGFQQPVGTVETLAGIAYQGLPKIQNRPFSFCEMVSLILSPILQATEIDHGIGDAVFKKFFEKLQQQAFIVNHFQLNEDAVTALSAQPEKWFGIKDIHNWTISNLKTIANLSQLAAMFNSPVGRLVDYFGTPIESAPDKLANITGWPSDQLKPLFKYFFNEAKDTHIKQILTLQMVFQFASQLGKTPDKIILNIWDRLWKNTERGKKEVSQVIFSVLKSKAGDQAWPVLQDELERQTNLEKRNLLTGYVMHKLTIQTNPVPIKTTQDLYEYLLIDVEMGSETETTWVKNAIATYQLYINRCRMHLEKGTELTDSADLESSWAWMQHYRLWEANQKVFLYPENYWQPELRKDKSYLFKTLEETLSQGEVSDENVEKGYKQYMDELALVSNLKICGNYLYPEPGSENKKLVLVGRTNTAPLRYYYRTGGFIFDPNSNPGVSWDAWQEIKVTINVPHNSKDQVYPVYAFGKLFIFWIEISEDKHDHNDYWDGRGQPEPKHSLLPVYKASIKYTYHDANHNWTQPQVVSEVAIGEHENGWWRKLYLVFKEKDNSLFVLYKSAFQDNSWVNFEHVFKMNEFFDVETTGHKRVPALWLNQNLPLIESENVLKRPADDVDLYYPVANQPDWFIFEAKKGAFLIKPNNNLPTISKSVSIGTEKLSRQVLINQREVLINSNDRVDLKFTDFTIEFWVKCDTLNVGMNYILSQGRGLSNHGLIIRIDKEANGLLTFLFDFYNNGIKTVQFPGEQKWVHCAVTYSFQRREKNIYFNGEQPNHIQYGSAFDPYLGEGQIFVGRQGWTPKEPSVVPGYLSELRIWNKVLSPQKIKERMFKFHSGLESNLIHYWPLQGDLLGKIKGSPDLISNRKPDFREVELIHEVLDASTGAINYTSRYTSDKNPGFDIVRLNSNATPELTRKLLTGGIKSLLRLEIQKTKEFPAFGPAKTEIDVEKKYIRQVPHSDHLGFDDADGIYFWELFFYAPLMLANQLNKGQKFADANNWYNYIFNPTLKGEAWRFLPLTVSKPIVHHHTQWTAEAPASFGGKKGSFKFNGTNAFIDCGEGIDLRNTDFTIEFWAKRENHSEENTFVSQGIRPEDNPLRIAFALNPFCFEFGDNYIDYPRTEYLYWEHWACVYSQNGFKKQIFFNGKLVEVRTVGEQKPYQSSGSFVLGKRMNDTQFYKGNITEVRIWTKALDGKQVRETMNRSLNQAELRDPNLLRYWPLDNPQENEAFEIRLGQNNSAKIDQLLSDPFDPDKLAHLRPVVFKKAVSMAYIDNLLDHGDALFREYTRESINEAVMYYIFGYDLLGKRPTQKPRDLELGQSVDSQNVENDISQLFLDALENEVIENGAVSSSSNLPVMPLVNAFEKGFCIPENEHFISYWNRVEDRLYKIRNGLNIEGVKQELPLFEPAIDPAALLRANAAGGSSVGIMAFQTPVPHYRFSFLLAKAKEFADQVSQLGGALLSALEKKDAEALILLRQGHENHILELTRGLKESQLEEASENVISVQQSLSNAKIREKHYNDLLQVGLSPAEIAQLVLMVLAHNYTTMSGLMRVGASLAHGIPQFEAKVGSPFTIGVTTSIGGQQVGAVLDASAGAMDFLANQMNFGANLSSLVGGFQRRAQDWELQKSLAKSDITQIESQIKAAEWRKEIASKDLNLLEKNIEQSQEVNVFLEKKFTNKELYQWMVGKVSSLYFYAFQMAHDLALSAEKAFQYELVNDDRFVTSIHWDSLKKGLLSGEALKLDLHRMEKAYLEKNKRSLEIEKTISLLQLNPLALLELKAKGTCSFQLSEALFSADFPGHYCRQIKSVSLSFPAIVGPYQNLNATLTQELNRTLVSADPEGFKYLLNGGNYSQDSVRSNWKKSEQVALSRGLNDSGLFQLNFQDERYLPFEGTGAISNWKLELSKFGNAFDFSTLTDVIIKIEYTALQGGEAFKNEVVKELVKKPVLAGRFFSLKHEFATAWEKFLQAPNTFSFKAESSMFKDLKDRKLKKAFILLDLTKAGYADLKNAEMSLKIGEDAAKTIQFKDGRAEVSFDQDAANFWEKEWKLNAVKPVGKWNADTINNIGMVLAYEGMMKQG